MARVGAVFGFFALLSCNYDWTYRPDAGDDVPSKDAGGDRNDPNPTDAGNGSPCSTDTPCPATQYCRFDDRVCGRSTKVGECRAVGADCNATTVCACNQTLMEGCVAQQNGIDVDEKAEGCNAKGTFTCGKTQCQRNAEACVAKTGGEEQCVACTACPCGYPGTCTCTEAQPGERHVSCP